MSDNNYADKKSNKDSSGDKKYSKDKRFDRGQSRRGGGRVFFKRKVCRICKGSVKINFKDGDALRRFTTERGKIIPRRITGTCAKHQRRLATAIKRARVLALLPFVEKFK
ncbi:MAG: 30S ribosomal protein S18 [Spirochaetales bacterium]|nr:30S ribosomal protein S18 [Spirochaetales bacterium]